MIEKDVNQFCANQGSSTRFRFIVADNHETASVAVQNTILFSEMNISVVIGHPWQSQCCASISYADHHGMILFSPSAPGSACIMPGENYLRLAPEDKFEYRVIAKVLSSYGIEACVVISLDWDRGWIEALEEEFSKHGGVIERKVIWDWDILNASTVLEEAEAAAQEAVSQHGSEHVAVLIIGWGEMADIIKLAYDRPTLYSLPWFGCGGTAKNPRFIEEVPEESAHLRVFSLVLAPQMTENYTRLNERYESLGYESLDFQMASTYYACWIAVQAIMEAGTTEAERLLEVIPEVAARTHGASGHCKLDSSGDRETADYEIWGCGYSYGRVRWIEYGRYNSMTDGVVWDIEALGFTPEGT